MEMSERFDKLFERMKLEFKKQTMEQTYSLTTNISIKLEAKLKPLRKENQELKAEIETLEKKIGYLERETKRNNVIIFGLEEKETCISELLEAVRRKICEDLKMSVLCIDINNVYRVGKRNKNSTKPRPVVVTFVHKWKRNEVLRNKKRFRNVFVSEDFPKDIVEKRRLWLPELKEERKKGKVAYLVYDKLLIKPRMLQNATKEESEEEAEKKEELSELLDGIEKCEQEEEKPRRRRAKAMINRNNISDEDKKDNDEEKPMRRAIAKINSTNSSDEDKKNNDEEKPRRRAKAMINLNDNCSGEEILGERALKNFRHQLMFNKKENSIDADSQEDFAKSKTGAIKKTYKKDVFSNDDNGKPRHNKAESANNHLDIEYVPQKRRMDY